MPWSEASILVRHPPTTSARFVAEIRKLEPDVIIPMHCSGNNFIQAVRHQMPEKLLVPTTGSRIAFGA
jgi:7,8-dihydropterin-6-yl-methyl-4-(beta-D-ribofuranosyl)aminobenzene 5'-phosphate synthase